MSPEPSRPRARLIVAGTELLLAKRDANGPVVAAALVRRGFDVAGLAIVPDDRALLARALREAAADADLVVVTGGLGPTTDDLTREAIADVTGCALVEDATSRATIEERLQRVGRSANVLTLRQALVPEGSAVVPNVNGQAAGAVLDHAGVVIAVLPGPPFELAGMLEPALDLAVARLRALGRAPLAEAPASAVLVLCGIGESDAQIRSESVTELEGLQVAWLAQPAEVRVIVSGESARVAAAHAALATAYGAHVVSRDGRSLADVVVATLAQRMETITCAESCTGGLVAAAITSVSGSSAIFRRAFVTYENDAKSEILGVPPELLERHGAVSAEVAQAMAAGARRAGRADWSIATTGIAGPTGGSDEKPVGLVYIAIAKPDGAVITKEHRFTGPRDVVRQRTVASALDMVRRAT